MQRAALQLGAFVLAWLACARVSAHGLPPDAYAVLSQDASGPRAVSFSAGVALRRAAQRYQFVCPSTWGDQFAAPVAALPDGSLVLGAASGLMLLADDGSLRAHPDPAAVGRSSDLVRSGRGVFALRATSQGSELLAVDAQTVHVIWKDPNSLFSLAALTDRLVLLRESGRMLEQVTLAPDGSVLERQLAPLDLPVDNVFARADVDAGAAYALVLYRNATLALGKLQMNVFNELARAEVSIAGPLSVDSSTLIAVDGALEQLVGGQATPLADAHNVVCLARHDGLSYACEREGISRLSGQVLGEPLFRFSWLAPPDLERVPVGDARMRCSQQWQDLLSDLQLTGISLLPDTALPGVGAAAGGGAAQLPGSALAAAGVGPAAAGALAVAPASPTQAGGTGCAISPDRSAPRAAHTHVLALVMVFTLVRCRRRGRGGSETVATED